jgi:multicomponent Na+:H+ antiporter subunit D
VTALLTLPIVLPLLGAGLSIMVGRSRAAQRVISLVVLTAVTGISIALAVVVDREGIVTVRPAGGRPRSASPWWRTGCPRSCWSWPR